MRAVTNVIEREGTLPGERIGMTIDMGALQHIMSVLTDLYSDPEMAVIREYATNARDSHIDAGNSAPIEVTTPTALHPFLTIRDYGLGLSAEDIRSIYSRYGTSTKRESDDVVGMLGLGCKSALTYCEAFTLTGYKDGRMIQVQIGRDEDGSGSMVVVVDEPTTEPNGVEVIIPAKRENRLQDKAAEFFSVWPEGSVLLNGVAPDRLDEREGGIWLDDERTLFLINDRGYGALGNTVVMGGVPYPVPSEVWGPREFGWYTSVIAFVDIGRVHFTPSREALSLDRHTRAALEDIAAEVKAKAVSGMQRRVEECATGHEAAKVAAECYQTIRGFGGDTLTWRGKEVPHTLTPVENTPTILLVTPSSRKVGDWRSSLPINRDGWAGYTFFTGFSGASMTPTRKAKAEQYLASKGVSDGRYLVLFQNAGNSREWLDPARVFEWAEVEAEVLPKATGGIPATGGGLYKTATVRDGRGFRGPDMTPAEIANLDPAKTHYRQGNAWFTVNRTSEPLEADEVVICLQANRVKKFRRLFPKIRALSEVMAERQAKRLGAVDQERLQAALVQSDCGAISPSTYFSIHEAGPLLDPALLDFIDILKKEVPQERQLLRDHGSAVKVTDPITYRPEQDYPLLTALDEYGIRRRPDTAAAVADALNSAYTTRKEQA